MVRVWDPAVRVFHWSLAGAFFAAYLLGDDGGAWHQAFGYAALGLVAFRVVWGFTGSQYAQFAHFVPSPSRFLGYVRAMLARREPRHLGHNPAGAVMIIALLSGIAVTSTVIEPMPQPSTALAFGRMMVTAARHSSP